MLGVTDATTTRVFAQVSVRSKIRAIKKNQSIFGYLLWEGKVKPWVMCACECVFVCVSVCLSHGRRQRHGHHYLSTSKPVIFSVWKCLPYVSAQLSPSLSSNLRWHSEASLCPVCLVSGYCSVHVLLSLWILEHFFCGSTGLGLVMPQRQAWCDPCVGAGS